VAIGFALAVTVPQGRKYRWAAALWLVHIADSNENAAIDYRETAPAATHRLTCSSGRTSKPIRAKSRDSGLGVGGARHRRRPQPRTPTVSAPESLPLAELVAPAVRLARDGRRDPEDDLFDSLQRGQQRLARWPTAARNFSEIGRRRARLGATSSFSQNSPKCWKRSDAKGRAPFYVGPVADQIVYVGPGQAGGLMTRRDPRRLHANSFANPVYGTYRGYEIVSMPPPSSGGGSPG